MGRLFSTGLALPALATIATPAAADPPYPAQLPDLAHPDHPHDWLYNPVDGRRTRPVLVLHVRFSDREGVARA